jgi:hypothetical protein
VPKILNIPKIRGSDVLIYLAFAGFACFRSFLYESKKGVDVLFGYFLKAYEDVVTPKAT